LFSVGFTSVITILRLCSSSCCYCLRCSRRCRMISFQFFGTSSTIIGFELASFSS
jgi:hypothetical protein